jgi:acetolactate synthase I/II/III large subunit
LLPNADVVLAIGARFEQQETNWKPDYLPAPGATFIQVDVDPVEIGKSVVAAIGIVGDARRVLQDLLAEIDKAGAAGRSNDAGARQRINDLERARAELESEIAVMVASGARPIHPMRVLRKIRDAFPRDATVGIDVGVLAQGMGGAYPYFKIYQPRATIVPSSFYGTGFVASAFPVARLVYPDRPAVCLVGDGSFQMVMNILPVAAELKLGVTWCILNDGALGSIRDIQTQYFSEHYIGTEFALDLDFARLAQACGCHGERIEDPRDIEKALQRAMAANAAGKPAVLDFVVATERLKGSVEFFAR